METLAIVVGILGFIVIKSMVKIVPQSDVYLVQRLGKYFKSIEAGFHIIIPFIDQIGSKITYKEQIIDIQKQSVITKDNVNISVDGLVFCKVQNAVEATYNVTDFKVAVGSLAMTTLRSEIGSMALDDTLSNRETLNAKLQKELGNATANWGIIVTRVEISEISVPYEIEEAMNMQMKAEREKRAIELNAEAKKEAIIRDAEANKQTEVLKAEAIERMADAKRYEQETVAEGQKKAMHLINESMSDNPVAAEFLLAKDRIKAFDELAKNPSKDKVIVPFEVTEFIGSLSLIKDMLVSKK